MATVASVTADINGAITYVRNRGGGSSNIADRFANSISSKIMQLPSLTPLEADEIMELLQDSPFDESSMRTMTAAIESRMTLPGSSRGAATTNYRAQLLLEPDKWFTAQEAHRILDKTVAWELKVELVVGRFRMIGCSSPHEQTYKWLMALLVLAHY